VRGGKRWFKLKKGRASKNISFLKNNTDFKLRDQNSKKMVLWNEHLQGTISISEAFFSNIATESAGIFKTTMRRLEALQAAAAQVEVKCKARWTHGAAFWRWTSSTWESGVQQKRSATNKVVMFC
jgi:hypothetical protein